VGRVGQVGRSDAVSDFLDRLERPDSPESAIAALFLVDARHPGLDNDVAAWRWLQRTVERCAVAATKIDKLARGERIRALRAFESVLETSVLPVSAVTGEGLDELWKLIERLPTNPQPQPRSSSHPLPKATATRRRPHRKS